MTARGAPLAALARQSRGRVRSLLAALACALGVLVGCGGGPEPGAGQAPPAITATLTVVVWSSELQQPVPALGRLTRVGDGLSRPIDTSSDAAAGQVFPGLAPGRYRAVISHRLVGTRPTEVEGEGVVFLEPGADERETIVVTDQEDDRLGQVPAPTGPRQR